MTGWANGHPPPQLRLPIDEELMRLAGRQRSPAIRSDSAILTEFPTLNWDGPYRATRFLLYCFCVFRGTRDYAIPRHILQEAKTHINLLRDIRKSVRVYVDKSDELFPLRNTLVAMDEPSREKEWQENFLLLKLVAVRTVEILEEITQDALRKHNKSGRPPTSWKSDFVWWLANLWRIVTGEDASKDLASPFASFVAAAWASLRNDLPEIPWASQIRRRRDILPAADLVKWANAIREHAIPRVKATS
jgi:hypothetical protein